MSTVVFHKDNELRAIQELLLEHLPNSKDLRDRVIETLTVEESKRFYEIRGRHLQLESSRAIKRYYNPVITKRPTIPYELLCEVIELHKNKTSYLNIYNFLIDRGYYAKRVESVRKEQFVAHLLHVIYPKYLNYNQESTLKEQIITLHNSRPSRVQINTKVFFRAKQLHDSGKSFRYINKIIKREFDKVIDSHKYMSKNAMDIIKQDKIIKKRNALSDELIEMVNANKKKWYNCPYCDYVSRIYPPKKRS